jgi:uncharacterized membrane-anchored protein
MEIVSVRRALGGRWASSFGLAVAFFLPASLIVGIQDRRTPFAAWWFVLIDATLQHVVITATIAALVAIAHHRRTVLPLALTLSIWAVGGAARGAVGSWFASEFAGVSADYGYRIAYWMVVTLVWNTLVTYIAAQFGEQSALNAQLAQCRSDLAVARATAATSESDLKHDLLASVRDAIAPVILEIRASVAVATHRQTANFEALSQQIEGVAEQIDSVIDSQSRTVPAAVNRAAVLSPLRAALRFDSSRPVFASMLALIGAAVVLVPEEFHDDGLPHAAVAMLALAAGATTLILLHYLYRWMRGGREPRHWASRLFRVSAAIATGATYLAANGYFLADDEIVWVVLVPISFYFASTSLSAAVGLGESNISLLTEIDATRSEAADLRESNRRHTDRVRAQTAELMHGPILGRLSACVMALNFHEAAAHKDEVAARDVATRVSAHLELVSRDLEVLSTHPIE